MAIVPFRGLAERGILRDPAAYQLDLNAWSGGSGVRFHSNKAMRAQVLRTVSPLAFAPRHTVGYRPSTGYDSVFLFSPDGHSYRYTSGGVSSVSPSGYVGHTTEASFNSTALGDVLYVNRPDAVPTYFGPFSTTFLPLPNWDASWRCRSLRAFGDHLIALNVSLGTNIQKTLVKWSDLTLVGQVPGSWDATDSTKNTGENPLEDVDTPLVDGLAMRDIFCIYAYDQIWGMTAVAGNDIFQFRRLFSDGGMMAPNCAVEVAGRHYVFGPNDIYVHDGTTKTSLVDQRNRDYIFRNLDMRASEACFVKYDPSMNEISFCYRSGEAEAAFQGGTRCNRKAVYNIPGDTWAFADLPNVSSMSSVNLDAALSYAGAAIRGLTYATIGGSYYDQDSGFSDHVVVGSEAGGTIAAPRLLVWDFASKGSVSFPYEPEPNAPAFLERTGIDLDQIGSDLVTYKNVRRVYPLVTTFGSTPIKVQLGGALMPSGPITWGPKVAFDPGTQYKVDYQRGGRYLAIRFTVDAPVDFEVNGFDLEIGNGGRR